LHIAIFFKKFCGFQKKWKKANENTTINKNITKLSSTTNHYKESSTLENKRMHHTQKAIVEIKKKIEV